MAVKSSAFGSVTLTGDDAQKFKRQVAYGRPKEGAKENVKSGVDLAREFRDSGRCLTIRIQA